MKRERAIRASSCLLLQMMEVRRIYRAQYLQQLAVVTNDERLKQIEHLRNLYRGKQALSLSPL